MPKKKSKFYVTTAIAYVNAAPHIGFAMEIIQADCLARYHRARGEDVWFLTGTDEHGTKIQQTAKKFEMTPQELADKNAPLFEKLAKDLNLSNDDFIRTSSARHKKGAAEIWKKLVEVGDIYKAEYKGHYCVGCEAFVTEKDLVNGKCPEHDKEPELVIEENYFFKLSKYSAQIAELIRSDELRVWPEARKNEILAVCEDGLTDVSFSRPVKTLEWGIPVPEDENQFMYVWCDALSNYFTALEGGEKFKKYWPADAHVIGKGILRFHAGVWIGMLLSAKLPIPKSICVHGYITSEGQKMSKSLGNTVDPFGIIEEWGCDPVRYYLLKEIPTMDDGDFSRDRFKAVYDSDLANNFGNLFSRVLAMTAKYFEGVVPASYEDKNVSEAVGQAWDKYDEYFECFDLKKACEEVYKLAALANQYVDENKPWELAKNDKEKLAKVIYVLLELLRHIAMMLWPFIPETADKMLVSLGHAGVYRAYEWGMLKEGGKVGSAGPLFPRKQV